MKKEKLSEGIRLSRKDILRVLLEAIVITLVLDYYFFSSLKALIIVLPAGYAYFRMRVKEVRKSKKNEASLQFKELMLLAATSQRAGYSVENAFINSFQDMKNLFGGKSYICRLIKRITVAKKNNMSISKIFIEEGENSRIDEIREFGYVYEIAYSHSGNMTQVMEKCASTFIEKLEIQDEINIALNERVFEMKIMSLMPFLIMSYIKLTNRGYFNVMYEETTGKIIMLMAMLVYVGSFLWSNKIVSIEV